MIISRAFRWLSWRSFDAAHFSTDSISSPIVALISNQQVRVISILDHHILGMYRVEVRCVGRSDALAVEAAGPTSVPRTTLSHMDAMVESRPRNLVAWRRSLTKTTSQVKILSERSRLDSLRAGLSAEVCQRPWRSRMTRGSHSY